MSKALIIGAHTGGIGDAIVATLNSARKYMPRVEDLDVRDQGSVTEYIAKHGPFDYIAYSAGISLLQWIKDTRFSDLTKVMDINAVGPVLVAQAHLAAFPDANVRMAVVVSDAASTPMRGSIAYCMSKAAEEMAVRVMARELAPKWTVVGVSPGVVEDTPMTNKLVEEIPAFRGWSSEHAREYAGLPPIQRQIDKQEVADAVFIALTGPQALNGSIITINGGK